MGGVGPESHQKFAHDLLDALQGYHPLTLLQEVFLFVVAIIPLPFDWKLYGFSAYSDLNISLPILLATLIFLYSAFVLARKILLVRYYKSLPYTLFLIKPPRNNNQSTFQTSELFTVIHSLGRQVTFKDRVFGRKKLISCELVSTKEDGIRYIARVPTSDAEIIRKSLYAYIPDVVIEKISDYLPDNLEELAKGMFHSVTFKLSGHFLMPLQSQASLSQHDPMAFITSHMTKLADGDLISLQVVLTPITRQFHKSLVRKTRKLDDLVHNGFDITKELNGRGFDVVRTMFKIVKYTFLIVVLIILWPFTIVAFLFSGGRFPLALLGNRRKQNGELSSKQVYLQEAVGQKIGEELFESTVRLMLIQKDSFDMKTRLGGIISALSVFNNGGYQSFLVKRPLPLLDWLSFLQMKHRLLSLTANPVLSVTEASSLYHLPFSDTTKTEDLVNTKSKILPAPLSLKQSRSNLDVTFAKNNYAGREVPIGLTLEERRRHAYVLGATGTGKSTLLLSMINDDLTNGKGMAVVDPHGDLAESVLACVPEDRADDLIYFNPDDLEHPIGLNLLELTPSLDENDALREKEFVTESVVSLFRKVFSDSLTGNPHRIEYILRNAIYTAFHVENPTIFTVYDLLNDPDFRRSVTKNLTDERLVKFWKNEFGKSGDWQKVKMISPVTARIGRFLFSPSAKRILEQPKSTINFDEILDQGKILVCNLSKGKIGEDTSQVLGITILNKIQLASLKRSRLQQEDRRDFFLYVDEFQHFANNSFIGMLSEARKYRLDIVMAEQSTSQQSSDLVNVILANVGTTIMFRSANPQDEKRSYLSFILKLRRERSLTSQLFIST
jgi:Helicase HerA, central domain